MRDNDPTIDGAAHLALAAVNIIAGGSLDAAEGVIHPDYYDHAIAADRPGGLVGFTETALAFRRSFAEMRFEPHDVIVAGEKVVVRGTFSARHVGPFAGMPVTGRIFSAEQIHIFRITERRVIEHWVTRDDAGALRQLGLLRMDTEPGIAQSAGVRSSTDGRAR